MQFESTDYKIKMQLALHYSLSLKSSQTIIFFPHHDISGLLKSPFYVAIFILQCMC